MTKLAFIIAFSDAFKRSHRASPENLLDPLARFCLAWIEMTSLSEKYCLLHYRDSNE